MRFSTPVKILSFIWIALLVIAILPIGAMANQIALGLIGFLLVAHAIEFGVFQAKLKKKPHSPVLKIIYTLVFGLMYIKQRS